MDAGLTVVEVAPGVHHARSAHTSWVLVLDGDEVTLVDTGYPGDRERVIASLERVRRSPADVAAVVLTHAHPDHVGSAEHLRTAHATPVWAHEAEVAHARGERIEQVSGHALARSSGPRLLPDFFHTDPELARTSLGKIEFLPADVVVPGHGEAFLGAPQDAVRLARAER